LFGFVCASAAYRAGIGPEELKRQSLVQLVRMFGPQAATPLWQELHDWAQEPLTAAKEDTRPLSHHPMYQEGMVPSEWRERVFLAGTENALNHGGYLEGALESAELAVADLLKSIALQPPQPLALNT
jgi:monoamine oxidase